MVRKLDAAGGCGSHAADVKEQTDSLEVRLNAALDLKDKITDGWMYTVCEETGKAYDGQGREIDQE